MLEARDVDGAVDTLGRLLELAEVDPPGRGRTLLGLPFFLASVHERLAPCHFRRRDFAKAATHYARANALQPVQRDTAIKHRLCVSLAGGAIKSSHCLDAAGGRGYRAEMGMPGSSDG